MKRHDCSRILGKYRLQYDFDDLLSGNAEQHGDPLSMWLPVRRLVSVLPSPGLLAIRLDDRVGLSLFGSILIHVVVIFGIGFTTFQEKPDPILPTLRVTLVNAPIKNPEDASFLAQYNQPGSGTETPFEVAKTPLPITQMPPVIQPELSVDEKSKSEFSEPVNGLTMIDSILALVKDKLMEARLQAGQRTAMPPETLVVDSLFAGEVDRLHQHSHEQNRHAFVTSSTRESAFASCMES